MSAAGSSTSAKDACQNNRRIKCLLLDQYRHHRLPLLKPHPKLEGQRLLHHLYVPMAQQKGMRERDIAHLAFKASSLSAIEASVARVRLILKGTFRPSQS